MKNGERLFLGTRRTDGGDEGENNQSRTHGNLANELFDDRERVANAGKNRLKCSKKERLLEGLSKNRGVSVTDHPNTGLKVGVGHLTKNGKSYWDLTDPFYNPIMNEIHTKNEASEMKSRRNDSCHCGSGKKYKNCHGKKSRTPSYVWLLLLGVAAIVAIVVLDGKERMPSPASNPVTPQNRVPATQPGVAPPGKVWSAEHGHWHDAPKENTQPAAPSTQPPGPAPAGKVWSTEHGHWHDSAQTEKQVVIP